MPLARTLTNWWSRRQASCATAGARLTVLSSKPGQRLAPQRVFKATSSLGDSEVGGAVIMVAGRGLAVELFVATAGQSDETLAPPHFDPRPMNRIEVHAYDEAAQVSRHFP